MEMYKLVSYIWMVFGPSKLETKEVEMRLAGLFNYHCPDSFMKTMTKLKAVGLVKGEMSMEKCTMLWWVDDECRAKDPRETLSSATVSSEACGTKK